MVVEQFKRRILAVKKRKKDRRKKELGKMVETSFKIALVTDRENFDILG